MTESHFNIAGIGASAGGLEAIVDLFTEMPVDPGMAFVVVQHLSPDFKSHMEDLLGRKTDIPIHRVVDGMEVKPNNIYLIPPNTEMVINEGRLRLTERARERTLSHPIDQFFRSLAADKGRLAIGVVLSGTGSDGARGVVEIADNDGLVIAQDPKTAGFDGMPQNAIATGSVHVVLSPKAMPDALMRYTEKHLSPEALAREDQSAAETGIDRIFEILRSRFQVDFSYYKGSTVGRRVARRIEMMQMQDLEEYLDYLQKDQRETEVLYEDLLIGVTHFFRDVAAFDYLEREVIPALVSKAIPRGSLRIWIAGCATGEEAYSIAMLVDEEISNRQASLDVKIFATDIHQRSLARAAEGCYSEEALAEVSEKRLRYYFRRKKDGFHVIKDLRNKIVFAPHNVFADAPFTQLDLVCCRNLLIYLQPTAQKKALAMFHFALKTGGVLFLGPSETPGDLADEFEEIESRWRIYRKRRDVRLPIDDRAPLAVPTILPRSLSNAGGSRPTAPDADLIQTYDHLLQRYMPASILIEEDYTIVHTFGSAGQFLRIPEGRPSSNILDLIDENLKAPLSGALQHARREQQEVHYTGLQGSKLPGNPQLRLSVLPILNPQTGTRRLLVRLEKEKTQPERAPDAAHFDMDEVVRDQIDSLEGELRFTRENLQATIEELETSNEELQATNEEMMASNEELQSTNEELQSVNEELYTVNSEYQKKIDELVEANDDMDNLLALTQVGVVFLDEELCIRRYTPAVAELFNIMPQDVGRPISSFAHSVQEEEFTSLIETALRQNRHIEERVTDRSGAPYLLRINPYRKASGVSGVVLAMVNIDTLISAEQSANKFEHMSQQASDMHVLLDDRGNLQYANPRLADETGYAVDELIGQPMRLIDATLGRKQIARLIDRDADGPDRLETTFQTADGTSLPVEMTISHVRVAEETLLFLAARNISERKEHEADLMLYRSAFEATQNGICIAKSDNGHPLTFVNTAFCEITGYDRQEVIGRNCRFLQGEDTDRNVVAEIGAAIGNGRKIRRTLYNYRKDGQPFWNDLTISPVRGTDGNISHFVGVQTDVSQVIAAGEQADEQATTLQALLDSTAEGIYGLDTDGRCTFVNQAALSLLGYEDAKEVIGKSMHSLIHHTNADGLPYPKESCPIYRACRYGSEAETKDDLYWRRNGSSFPVSFSAKPVVLDGTLAGAVVNFTDETEQKAAAAELIQARKAADAANRAKSAFLANMSHEIRTPLSAILSFAELLEISTREEQNQANVDAIKRNGLHLLSIVNDILDLSKIEAEQLEIHLEPINVQTLMGDIGSVMGGRAHSKNLELGFCFSTPVPEEVLSDPVRLRQILFNLIGNAIKFTEAGRVDVDLSWQEPDLTFAVRDTGIGIADTQLAALFEAFHQADGTIERRYGGTGLGLSISKRLVEMLDGTISVESELGEGSTFTLSLPVQTDRDVELIDSLPSLTTEAETGSETPIFGMLAEQPRILIADDQPDVRESLQQLLTISGAVVDTVADGFEVRDRVTGSDHPYDIFLLDLEMPGLTGLETLRHLRSMGVTTPVVAVTAQAMRGERKKALQAGFDAFLAKPVEQKSLVEVLSKLLSSSVMGERILIVDDHADTSSALAALLAAPGRAIRTAASASEMRNVIAGDFIPSLVIMDLHVGEASGFDLLEELTTLPALAKTRYVALTGMTAESTKRQAEAAGFDAFVDKPPDIDHLRGLVAALHKDDRSSTGD